MILLTGIPNAGKTTYSERFTNVIHYDGLRTARRVDEIVEAVKKDNAIVVDGMLKLARDRKRLVKASTGRNVCIWLDVPVEVCVERERNYRKRPDALVILCAQTYEPPTYNEGWDEIIVVRDGKETVLER